MTGNNTMAKNKDDLLWKGIIEDVFEDFLAFFYPGIGADLDLDKGIQFLDKELEQVFPPEEDEYPRGLISLVRVIWEPASLMSLMCANYPIITRLIFWLAQTLLPWSC